MSNKGKALSIVLFAILVFVAICLIHFGFLKGKKLDPLSIGGLYEGLATSGSGWECKKTKINPRLTKKESLFDYILLLSEEISKRHCDFLTSPSPVMELFGKYMEDNDIDKALKVSERLIFKLEQSNACIDIGKKYFKNGDRENAVTYINKAKDIIKEAYKSNHFVHAIIKAYKEIDEYELAHKLAEDIGLDFTYCDLAVYHYKKGEKQKAYEILGSYTEKVLNKKYRYSWDRNRAKTIAAECYLKVGDDQKALELAKQNKDREVFRNFFNQIIKRYNDDNICGKIMNYAKELYTPANIERPSSRIYGYSNIYNQCKEDGLDKELLLELLKKEEEILSKEVMEDKFRNGGYKALAKMYQRAGYCDDSLNSIRNISEEEVSYDAVSTLVNVSYCFLDKKDIKAAKEVYEEAFSMASRIEDGFNRNSVMNSILRRIEDIHSNEGLEKKLIDIFNIVNKTNDPTSTWSMWHKPGLLSLVIEKYLVLSKERAMQLADQINGGFSKTAAFVGMGRYFHKLGNKELAFNYFEKAFEEAKKLNENQMRGGALRMVSKAYLKLGYTSEANSVANHIKSSWYGDRLKGEIADAYSKAGNLNMAKKLNRGIRGIRLASEEEKYNLGALENENFMQTLYRVKKMKSIHAVALTLTDLDIKFSEEETFDKDIKKVLDIIVSKL